MAHWYVLHAKPHKERQVSSLVRNKGYEVYLPTLRVRRRGKDKVVPFFSCYLFARMEGSADFSAVQWTPGLRAVVSFGDEPVAVPDEAISLIKERLASMRQSRRSTHPFQPGDRVTIRSGPFVDLEAVFEEGLSSRDRARILVDCLGRWTRCKVDIHSLKKRY